MSGLIDRDAAVEILMEQADYENKRRYERLDNNLAYHRSLHAECCLRRAADRLKKLPDAGPKVKLAYLKKSKLGNLLMCSQCGCSYPPGTGEGFVILNYCAKCGAQMVKNNAAD